MPNCVLCLRKGSSINDVTSIFHSDLPTFLPFLVTPVKPWKSTQIAIFCTLWWRHLWMVSKETGQKLKNCNKLCKVVRYMVILCLGSILWGNLCIQSITVTSREFLTGSISLPRINRTFWKWIARKLYKFFLYKFFSYCIQRCLEFFDLNEISFMQGLR